MSLLSEFRAFITKGNVVDLAVAVVFGVAFNTVITAFINDIISPLIGIAGSTNFNAIVYTVHGSTFYIGTFISAVISFLTIAVVIFFLLVRPVSKYEEKQKAKMQATPTTKICPECLSTIPLNAKRCMYCTSKLG